MFFVLNFVVLSFNCFVLNNYATVASEDDGETFVTEEEVDVDAKEENE